MQKTMIIICRQCVKTNTFSLSFHILFSHFSPFLPKTHRNPDLGMGKNGVGPPQEMIREKWAIKRWYMRDFGDLNVTALFAWYMNFSGCEMVPIVVIFDTVYSSAALLLKSTKDLAMQISPASSSVCT